ncbi:MAG: histidine kinase [Gammaproteobacteria bacterium]|nr:histidine kinase [Gammaproteobacteria bacterium]
MVGDTPDDIARDIFAVSQIEAVPILLEVLCEITGMRFAVVARVTDTTWTACAVKDEINFGLGVGGRLDLESTLCIEAKRAGVPIIIDHASVDPRYCLHHTPRRYQIESYVSVPIVLGSGRYFGNLCAIDPEPANVSDPRIVNTFIKFAALIALQLESQGSRERAEKALEEERATNELRDQFIAILGHDLRNPLQAVVVASALMERKSSDPELKSIAARVRTNARRMSSLIDDVLDFARSRLGGGIGVNIDEITDIDKALSAVVKEFQDGQPERQIIANIRVERPVHCDLARIQQVASNLIGNAFAHGAASSPVKFSALADDGDFVIEVWNAGEPIPPASIAKIFEPFWRHSASGGRQGLGLGLHICSQIVRAHGGSLAVTSSPRDGTMFSARFPLRKPGGGRCLNTEARSA